MPSIIKNKISKPRPLIRFTSGISYGNNVDASSTLVTSPRGRARKSRKASRGSITGRFDSAIMSMSSSNMEPSSSTSDSPLSHRPPNDIADLELNALHLNRDWQMLARAMLYNEVAIIPASTDPGTGMHNRETSLEIPPSRSTPPSRDSFVDEVDNTLMKSITYDAILASTLQKDLGMTESTKYLDIPATRTPPNSPAAIYEGGFGSLTGVSMAIMEGGMLI